MSAHPGNHLSALHLSIPHCLAKGKQTPPTPKKNTKFLIIKLRGDFSVSNWKKENVKPTQQNGGFRRSWLQIQRCNVLEKKKPTPQMLCSCLYIQRWKRRLQMLLAVDPTSTHEITTPVLSGHPSWMNPNFSNGRIFRILSYGRDVSKGNKNPMKISVLSTRHPSTVVLSCVAGSLWLEP
jgi:hypothetical protein